MSNTLIARNADLQRLVTEGFEVEVRAGHLLIHGVPYVDSRRTVVRGSVVTPLQLVGDVTVAPTDHIVSFAGEYPYTSQGEPLESIRHASERRDLGCGIFVDHSFSNKPAAGYPDHYAKVTRYIAIISAHARAIDPHATAQTFKVIGNGDNDSVFLFRDTASSRAGIGSLSDRLRLSKVAIIGLGGTGTYVLDLVAKTEVRELHLFDGDRLEQHNAFRVPGAISLEELSIRPMKVHHFAAAYSKMRKGVVPHDYNVDANYLHELSGSDFVFVCIDSGAARRTIVDYLVAAKIPFVDVGMGLHVVESSGRLGGLLRTTLVTAEKADHVEPRIPMQDSAENLYATNIQVADLNCLNAALAVVKWKKFFGYHDDLRGEHNCIYSLGRNMLLSEDDNEG